MKFRLLLVLLAVVPAAAVEAAPAPARPAAKAAAAEPESKVEGQEIARPGKGFLGLKLENSAFKLSFYDSKRQPAPADATRAVLRWDPSYKVGKERVVLLPGGEPHVLSSPRIIRPPHQFRLTITLLRDEASGDDAGEVLVVDFRG